jgi:AcrR family transcriptional regulator
VGTSDDVSGTVTEPSAASEACDPSPKRGRPRSAEVDAAVLAATLEVAREVGITRLSMDDVADRAGVSKATIYRRWPSKEQLVLDALRSAVHPIGDVDTGSLRGDLERYLGEVAERYKTGAMSDVLPHLIEVACHDDNLRSSLDDYVQTRRMPLRAIVERGRARGEVRPEVDVEALIDSLVGAINYRRLLSHQPVDAPYVSNLLDVVLGNCTTRND